MLPWQSGQQLGSSALAMPLSRDDFVAAIVTDESHEQFAHAGRAWRQASPSYIQSPAGGMPARPSVAALRTEALKLLSC